MARLSSIMFCFILIFAVVSSANAQPKPQQGQRTIETGKFRFYETKLKQGEETYEIRADANGELTIQAKTEMPSAFQKQKPLVNATLRTKSDLTPLTFEIKGPTLLEIEEDTSIVVQDNIAKIKDRETANTINLSSNFFTLSGYIPLTIEMMLVRYWLTHGRPASIRLLPAGEAFVELRGKDTLTMSGKTIDLTRFHLSGNNWRGGWGRQTIWLDSENRLIAAVNLGSDLETNIYAFSEDYESAISFFLKRSVEDAIDRFTQVADQISPKTTIPIALVGGTLIDVTGKPAISNSAVVIQGDRIIAAGPRSTIEIPNDARVIDITGKYLLPGLWDMHSHFYNAEFGPTYLAAGITTARDVGNDIEFGTALRDAAKEKRGLGPRMLLAGYIDGKSESHAFDVEVETADEARAAVLRYKNAGYDQIKIRNQVKLATLKVIRAEAHRLGMSVMGHVPDNMNALQAVNAGLDQISHFNYVQTGFFPKATQNDFEVTVNLRRPNIRYALKVFKEHGTVIDPTLAVLELMLRPMKMPIESFEPGVAKVPQELTAQINKKGQAEVPAEVVRMVLDVMLKLLGALHKAGVPIVAGSDVGVPGHTLHRELELYVKAGLTPLQAIQTATITPAQVMKLDSEVGTIEAGKRADLIVVDANPLENIRNIRKLRYTVAQGRLFDSAKLWQSVGFKP